MQSAKEDMTSAHPTLPHVFVSFDDPDAATLEAVGGKGANLVKLTTGGFDVPPGFLVPTMIYRKFVEANGLNKVISEVLKTAMDKEGDVQAAMENASKKIRAAFAASPLDQELLLSLEQALDWLGKEEPDLAVAIRSSATAEDLPDLSFAGQQDTYLNVVGLQAAAVAVIDCWSSLWTARAIQYRSRNHISHEGVALSVVVQKMAPASASGVLFTANPLTGKRSEVVVDATVGLGEALVSGMVEPDHYVIETSTTDDNKKGSHGSISLKTLGRKAVQIKGIEGGGVSTCQQDNLDQVQALGDAVILNLAKLGKKIEEYYGGVPQDVEFAVTSDDKIYVLQSRPITSLYPLPSKLEHKNPLQIFYGFHLVQGVMEPYTPLGNSVLQEMLTGAGRLVGIHRTVDNQRAFLLSGMRLWINVTPILRHPIGRKALLTMVQNLDQALPIILEQVVKEDKGMTPFSLAGIPWAILAFSVSLLARLVRCFVWPLHMAQKTKEHYNNSVALVTSSKRNDGNENTSMADSFIETVSLFANSRIVFSDMVIPQAVPVLWAGMIPLMGILKRFSEEVAERTNDPRFNTLFLEIAKGLPNNVTTEMDMELWETAMKLNSCPETSKIFPKLSPAELKSRYQAQSLPPKAQTAVSTFLATYGCRGLGEIDIGRQRWSEDPEHIMGVLQSYMTISDPKLAPDAVFTRGAMEAKQAAKDLEESVRTKLPFGWFKAMLVSWAVYRYRTLGGLRESHKFFMIRIMGILRTKLLSCGVQMKELGWLSEEDDLFYLEVTELEALAHDLKTWKADGKAPASLGIYQTLVAERREERTREMRRKQLPRVLLSDGTAYYNGVSAPKENSNGDVGTGLVVGDAVSPGVVEGVVRVVFDPVSSQLQPGEILVCPGTDPAWTPLFLAAGGLVMEVGGMMTHGSVVAREYGIPAVVGVREATQRLETGQRIRLNGSAGVIEILDD